jgi:Uma2 family endonuclease
MDTLVMAYPETDYETERGKPMPSKNHSIIQNNLSGLFFMNYRKKYRFMSEIALDLEDWGSTPDLAIFPMMEVDFRHDEVKIKDVPLGIIEILSPSQALQELNDKSENYFHHGVKSAWLVIPSLRAIAIYKNPFEYQMFNKGVAKDEVLGIKVDLNEVFS